MYELANFYINISGVCELRCPSDLSGGSAVRLLYGIAGSQPAGSGGCLSLVGVMCC